ncbi:uncharacterized protein LY89DRAFT_780163 [Mollisia scopiformis]|uniref:Rhodopsin domain-containing protein n=1 Tax=Mollisia scopiformis TaxID=149040 RepID=A0A194XG93_MOLSC|nr:uncharacterized protein LY89DRAFT_780163 [Mollisia scopiformis]KUJ19154.1 hypothetical protein LY89DRAFT_780163 [Mollisia scopiformis]
MSTNSSSPNAAPHMKSPIDVSYINERSMIVVGALFPTLSIIFVCLRFYVRQKQKAKILADDLLLLPALAIIIGMGIAFIIGARGHGLGDTKGLPAGAPPELEFTFLTPQIILTEKVQFICQLMSVICIGCIKLSVVMFYRRIFVTHNKSWFSWASSIICGVIVAWTIAFFFVFLFYCGTHIEKEWSTVVEIIEYCPNALNDQIAIGVSDAIVDIAILLIPIPMILKLHLDTARKIMVMSIFLLGGFAVAASIVRMAIFIQVVVVGFTPALDGDKDISLILFWTMVESGTAIVAACLPTMKVLTHNINLENFLRSIKSTFSLPSRGSQASVSKASSSRSHVNGGSSIEYITRPEKNSKVESCAMHDMESFDFSRSDESAIQVQKTFRQESIEV